MVADDSVTSSTLIVTQGRKPSVSQKAGPHRVLAQAPWDACVLIGFVLGTGSLSGFSRAQHRSSMSRIFGQGSALSSIGLMIAASLKKAAKTWIVRYHFASLS